MPVLGIYAGDHWYGGGSSRDWNFNFTNPAGNSVTITQFTINSPAGWTINWCDEYSPYFFDTCTSGPNTASWYPGSGGAPFPPGAKQDLEIGLTWAAGSTYPLSGVFTSTFEAGGVTYTGPSFTMYSFNPSAGDPVISIGGTDYTSSTYSFTAGGSPLSVTADIGVANAGVPVTFKAEGNTGSFSGSGVTCLYPYLCYANTNSAGVASATFTPANVIANMYYGSGHEYVYAVYGNEIWADNIFEGAVGNTADYWYWAESWTDVQTGAASPSMVTITLPGSSSSTAPNHYITSSGTDAAAVAGATMAGSSASVSLADRFTNPVAFAAGDTLTVLASNGRFNTPSGAPTTTKTTITCADFTGGCPTSGTSYAIPNAYFQSSDFGTIGTWSAQVTRSSVTYSGLSGNLITSNFDYGGVANTPTFPAGQVYPGADVNAGSTVMLHYTNSGTQKGVPVTFYLDTATSTQQNGDGYFSGTTAQSKTVNTAANSTATTTFVLDTGAGALSLFLANAAAPIDGDASNMLGNSTDTATVTTQAGPAAKLVVATYFDALLAQPTKYAVNTAGTVLYVNVALADKYGNPTTNSFSYQLQIALSGPGTFSATNVYIKSGDPDTATSFGPILWHTPSTLGAATVSASSSLSTTASTKTVTIVSAFPSLFVNTANGSPISSGSTFYVNAATVVVSGNASASKGYPSSVTIDSVCYKMGSTSGCASIAPANVVNPWNILLGSLAEGPHTVSFNATDSNGNTQNSSSFTVLVDTTAPTVAFTTADNSNLSGGATVAASITDTMGDLNATSVTVTDNGTAIASSHVSVTGANNPGHSVTYAVTISGLGSGTHVLGLSAMDLAGNTGTATAITVHISVPPNQTFTAQTPTIGTSNGFKTVTVTFTNNGVQSYSASVTFEIFSGTSPVALTVATQTIASGASATYSFGIPSSLASGSYTATVFVVVNGNSYSAPYSVSFTV